MIDSNKVHIESNEMKEGGSIYGNDRERKTIVTYNISK